MENQEKSDFYMQEIIKWGINKDADIFWQSL